MIRFASGKESKKDDIFTLVNTSKSLYFIFIISSHGLKEKLKTIKKEKKIKEPASRFFWKMSRASSFMITRW